MLTYIRDIDRYVSSWFRNSVNGSVLTIVSCLVIALLVRFSEQLKLSTTDRKVLVVGYIVLLVVWAGGLIFTLFRDSLPFDTAYQARFKALDRLVDSEVDRVTKDAKSKAKSSTERSTNKRALPRPTSTPK